MDAETFASEHDLKPEQAMIILSCFSSPAHASEFMVKSRGTTKREGVDIAIEIMERE